MTSPLFFAFLPFVLLIYFSSVDPLREIQWGGSLRIYENHALSCASKFMRKSVFFLSLQSFQWKSRKEYKKIKKVSTVNKGSKLFFTPSEIKIAWVHHPHTFADSFLFSPVLARPPMGQWGNGQKNGQRPNYFWGLWSLFSLAVSHITKQNDRELQFRT